MPLRATCRDKVDKHARVPDDAEKLQVRHTHGLLELCRVHAIQCCVVAQRLPARRRPGCGIYSKRQLTAVALAVGVAVTCVPYANACVICASKFACFDVERVGIGAREDTDSLLDEITRPGFGGAAREARPLLLQSMCQDSSADGVA